MGCRPPAAIAGEIAQLAEVGENASKAIEQWRNLLRQQPDNYEAREALDAMRAETIDAFVDLAGLGPGQYNLRVQVDTTQNDFGVSSMDPSVVRVTIK